MSTESPAVTVNNAVSFKRAHPIGVGRESWTVFRHEFRRLLLSPRTLIPMAIYAGFALLILQGFHRVEQKVDEKRVEAHVDKETFEQQKETVLGEVLKFAGWGDEGDAAEILRDHVPIAIVAFFAIASWFLPLLVAVVTFDQFSELSTRGARFALLRVRRETYVLGRGAAAIASVAAFLALMWLIVTLATGFHGTGADMPYALREGLRAWALMTVLALPYLSITATISAMVRPVLAFVGTMGALISLAVGVALVGHLFPFMLTRMGLLRAADGERKLLLLFPWQHAPKLISRDPGTLAHGVIGLLILALFGYLATLYIVRRRDV